METLFNYFWLIAIAVNVLNAIIFWVRAQPHIQKTPDLRPGYIKLVRGYVAGMSLPWVVMGIGMTIGNVPNIKDYFYPRIGNQFVIAWWVSIWALVLFLSDWIWFRGGAEKLIRYPGLLRGNPTDPKTIKIGCFLAFLGNIVASSIVFLWEHS